MTSLVLLLTVLQPPPPPPQDEAAQLAEAKQHFERGKELFKSGAYDQAIQEFKTADQIKPSPILAYNIGLSFENLGRCKAAINYFQRYLREQPEADNRADTEQKIQDQNAKLARGECAGQRAGQQPPPPPGGGGDFVQPPPPGGGPDVVPPAGPRPGMHGLAIGLRFGPIFGGIGSEATKDIFVTDPMTGNMVNIGTLENTTGFHLQPAIQFPLIMGPDRRVYAQGEVFGTIAFYSYRNLTLANSQVEGGAKFLAAGFAMRGNFFVSDRVPIAIAPALGFGVGAQFYDFKAADCDFSSGIPTAFIIADLAVKYELLEHHAFYFSPASLHFLLPGLSDGGDIGSCVNGAIKGTADAFFGTNDAKVNYGIDVGYMFQF